MLIQIILIAVIAVIIIRLFSKLKGKEIDGRSFFAWLALWLAAAAIIIWPGLTVVAANYVGIGRGADLVIYGSLIFLFYALFKLLVRIEKLEKNLTKLVRQNAIDNHESKQ